MDTETASKIDAATANELRVRSVDADVLIKPADGQEITFTLTGSNTGSYSLRMQENGTAAEVSVERNAFARRFFARTPVLEIGLPEESLDQASVRTVSGSITLQQPGVRHLQAESVSGTISLEGGDIDALDLHSTSGRILVKTQMARGSVRTVSGRIEAEIEQLTGDMQFTTVSGRMSAVFPEELPLRYDLQSTTGSITNGREAQAPQGYVVTMKSTSGALSLH